MQLDINPTTAHQKYEAAHEAHYTTKDLLTALELYMDLINEHPSAPEAEYARSQLQNIANSVVPKTEILRAHVGLALAHLAKDVRPTVESRLAMPLAADVPGWNI